MKAGRKLDEIIAKIIMGLEDVRYRHSGYYGKKLVHGHITFGGGLDISPWVPHYSTSIADAWLVVEKMRNKKTALCLLSVYEPAKNSFQWLCKVEFIGSDRFEFSAQDSAPLAICLAALKAMGGEE